jgi:hypothetical protein
MTIEKVAASIIDTTVAGYEIYLATAKAMDSIQARAQKDSLDWKQKRDWVLSYIKSTIVEVAENWQTWSELLIRFISSAKTFYNIVRVDR